VHSISKEGGLRDSLYSQQSERREQRVTNAARLARDSHRERRAEAYQAVSNTSLKPSILLAPLSSLCPSPTSRRGVTGAMKTGRATPIFMSPELSSLVAEENNSTKRSVSRPGVYPSDDQTKSGQSVRARSRLTPGYVKRCGHESIIVGYTTEDGPVHKALRKRCKSWRCFRCRRRLSAKWFRKIQQVKDITLALTLTFDPKQYSEPELAERACGKAWSRLSRRFRKVYGRRIEYLRLTEWHKSGYPHLHILLRGADLLDANKMGTIKELHSFFKKEGQRFGFGSICYVQQVYNAQGAASYVLADVTKTYQLRPDYRRGLRRIQASQKFFEAATVFKPSKPDAYAIHKKPLEELAASIIEEGGSIVSESKAEDIDDQGVPTGDMIVEGIGYDPPSSSRFNLFQ